MLTDEDLMIKVANGEVQKLSVLFNRYKRPLYNFFYRTSRDQMLSEDLIQNVFEKIIKYKHTFKDDANFKAWIYRIARNANHDLYRKNEIKVNRNVELSELNIGTEIIEKNYLKSEENNMLYQALNLLDAVDRETLILTKIEKLKYAEVAHIQNATESAVKVRVFRAMKKLKEQYHKLDDCEGYRK